MKIKQESSWNLPPTDRQISCITRMTRGAKYHPEYGIHNRQEARQIIYELYKGGKR